MLATATTYSLIGVEARRVTVEADVRTGLPSFTIVGLPDAAIRESRERVRSAIVNAGHEFPQRRITANLAPADLRKAGPGYDLALAAAVLVASGQLPPTVVDGTAFAGELALDGAIRGVPGALAMAEAAARAKARALVVARRSAPEAALVSELRVIGVSHIGELAAIGTPDEPPRAEPLDLEPRMGGGPGPDLADLRGQDGLAFALEVAAAGGHSLLMVGPPGAGKSMAARRLPSLLPPLDPVEAVEAIRVASVSGRPLEPLAAGVRPFRAPHHTISAVGLMGGGSPPRPGEISLAHRGVLFLDELPEFRRDALEALRQPMEDAKVLISRAHGSLEMPCRFQFVAAANPCPCGHGAGSARCECPEPSVRRYAQKLTGALADRIDLSLRIAQPKRSELAGSPSTSSAVVRDRVLAARERQAARLGPGRVNAEMSSAETRALSLPSERALGMLGLDEGPGELSGRGYDRLLRVGRTLADLDGSDRLEAEHLETAIALRARRPG